ncbi:hypothetical protein [Phytohabitans kaempferiae]|uniref:Glycosyltransferase RgtA/B/C/D-like domain-containing protein n=1 Tax=Phytohabitans kaempferiae TaxID=1620943 RepID=A0ABV6M1V6_9ACTN
MLVHPEPTTAPAASEAAATGRRRSGRRWRADLAVLLGLLALVPVVHSIGPTLRTPFWLDESWVAMSMRGSLGEAFDVTGPTPIGWTLLMRLIPGDGDGGERLRLLPAAFLAGSVVAGYALGRLLGWQRRAYAVVAGLMGAAGALLLPAQQVRHDLKQYTADGAVAVALLALAAWAEARWSWRRLTTVAGCALLAMFVSHTALLVGGGVLGAFVVVALVRRAWRDLLKAATVAVGGWLAMGVTYLTVSSKGQIESLEAYWDGYFLNFGDTVSLPDYLVNRLDGLGDLFGVPWPAFAVLALAGVVTMAVTGRLVAALATAALPVGMVVAGYLHAYPVLDQRTSHFLLVSMAVSAGIGVAGAARLVARLIRRWQVATTTVLAGATVLAFVLANTAWLRYYAPPGIYPRHPQTFAVGAMRYDVRDQVRYVERNRRPGDAVVVSAWANFGFAYYWQPDEPTFVRDERFGNGWGTRYDEEATRIVVATDRTRPAIRQALDRAAQLAGPGGRVWIVRTHLARLEVFAWDAMLRGRQVTWLDVGPEPLGLLTVPAGASPG